MNLVAILLTLAATCAPNTERAEQLAAACRLTGGRPDVATYARCTTRAGSCVWTTTYRSCVR